MTTLLLATLYLSWPALSGPFLFDDFPNLQHLGELDGRLNWSSLAHYVASYGSEPGRPLSMLSFVINDAAWPSEPWGFKYTNLLLHLLNGVIVFGLSRTLALTVTSEKSANVAALITMGAWLLHPLQLSTTMLVVQRMTQLSALFSFIGIWTYVALAGRSTGMLTAAAAIFALGVFTVLAILCKENGALTPVLAMAINFTLLQRRLRTLSEAERRVLHWGTALPVLILLMAIAFRWKSLTGYGIRDFTMGERLLSEARALIEYLGQIVVPRLRGGGIYHDDFVISRGLLDPISTLPSVILVCSLLLLAILKRGSHPLLSFAIFWFFAGHATESTVFPLELYFEHRNYLPMFGPLFALSLWLARGQDRWQKPALALAAIWIAFAAWLTSVQAPIWGDRGKLVTVWALEHPRSPRAIQQQTDYLNREGKELEAASLLISSYQRGVRGSDFPLQALLIACFSGNSELASRTRPLLHVAMAQGEFNNGLLETLRKLRAAVQNDQCSGILSADDWLLMTEVILANRNYAAGKAQAYVRVERSYFRANQRNLNETMRELEAAWSAAPTPKLARLIAVTLASAGLYDEALIWSQRALDRRVEGFRGLLSQDEHDSERLHEALKALQSQAQAKNAMSKQLRDDHPRPAK